MLLECWSDFGFNINESLCYMYMCVIISVVHLWDVDNLTKTSETLSLAVSLSYLKSSLENACKWCWDSFKKKSLRSKELIILSYHLQWVGHLVWMKGCMTLKHLLYSEVWDEKHPSHKPKVGFKDLWRNLTSWKKRTEKKLQLIKQDKENLYL